MTTLTIILIICLALSITTIGILLLRQNTAKQNSTKSSNKTAQNAPSTMVVEYDGQLTVTSVINPKPDLLFYATVDQIIGANAKNFEKIIPKQYHKQIKIIKYNVQKALNQKESQYFEYTVDLGNNKQLYAICFAEYITKDKICCHVSQVEPHSLYMGRQIFTHNILDTMVDNFSVGIFMRAITTESKEYILFNTFIKELYGVERITQSPQWDQSIEDQEDAQVLNSDSELTFHRIITDSNGMEHHISIKKRKFKSLGEGYYIAATLSDMTEIVNKNNSLKQANINLSLALNTSNASVWRYDVSKRRFFPLHGKIIVESGTTFEQCIDALHPHFRQTYLDDFDRMLNQGSDWESSIYCFPDPNSGVEYYFASRMSVIRDSEGNPIEILGTQRDITHEYQTRRELNEKLNLLEVIYNNIPAGMTYLDKNGTVINRNKIGLEMHKASENHMTDKIFDQSKSPIDIKAMLLSGENVHKIISTSDEIGPKHFDFRAVVVHSAEGEIDGYMCICTDITKVLENSKKMEEMATRYRAVLNSINIGVEVRNKDGHIIDINEADFELFGIVDRDEYIDPKRDINKCPGIDSEILHKWAQFEPVTSYIEFDFEKINQSKYYKTHRNDKITLEVKYTPMYDSSGHIIGSIILTSDVSENLLLNQKYRDLYRRQETILSMLPVGVEVYNADGTMIFQNEVACEIFGCENLTGKINIFENPYLTAESHQHLYNGLPLRATLEYDFDKITNTGYFQTNRQGSGYLDIISSAIRDDNNQIAYHILIIRDTTEITQAKKLIEETNIKLKMAITNSAIVPWDYDSMADQFIFNPSEPTEYILSIEEAFALMRSNSIGKVEQAYQIMKNRLDCDINFEADYYSISCKEWQYGTIAAKPFIYNKDGSVLRYAGFVKDSTNWYNMTSKLEALNEQNKLILDNTQSGFIYFTPDYRVKWENVSITFPEFSISKAYRKGIICYKDIKNLESPCPWCSLVNAIDKGNVTIQEVRIDETNYAEITSTPIFANETLVGVVMRVDNITERKRINLELKEAKEKAEQANLLKSAFLANMSHEIRTPLNAIVGFSDIILSAETKEEKEEFRKIISTNSEMLLNLINDILDLSKIESGYLEITQTTLELTELFRELQCTFSLRMRPGVELKCEIPRSNYQVDGLDKQRVLQIMSNFVSNATKFTPQGEITIGYKYQDNGVKLYVTDTGIGISQENQIKVFQRFQKFDSFAQGTGLGLSICKAIAEVMGGKIGFESKISHGSTFWVWLPCKIMANDQDIETTPLIEKRLNRIEGLHILIAEDNDSNYLLLKSILKRNTLVRATNGKEALEAAYSEQFDVILMDIRMPVMNGIEATTKIREFDTKTPIIALTANAFDADRQEAYKVGCTTFLTKPINKEKLLKTIIEL